MQSTIKSISLVLTKLWKIRNHTDPSTPLKKEELYKKYKELCHILADEYKEESDWATLVRDVHNLSFPLTDKENKEALQVRFRKQLIQDLEVYFVTKYVPSHLQAPSVEEEKLRLLKKKQRSQVKKEKQETYTTSHILSMAKELRLRQNASYQLQAVIEKYRKINPKAIEQQIADYLNKKKI